MVTDSKDGWNDDVVYCGYSHHERPWDASLVPASTGPNSRNTGGYIFVWVPKGTQLCGRDNPMLQSTLQGRHANMDPGRGHQILLLQNQPQLAAHPHSNERIHLRKVAQSRLHGEVSLEDF